MIMVRGYFREVSMNLNFDLNLLIIFNAIFETRSATLAGERLGRTQSAISNALKKLREATGDPLFVRGPNGLLPTVRAEEIEEHVRHVLSNAKMFLEGTTNFEPKTSTGQFKVGAPDRLSLPILEPFIESVMQLAPYISFQIKTTDRDAALIQLRDNGLDLVVGWFDEPPAGFNSKFLFKEKLVCLCRKKHPLLKQKEIALESLLEYRHVVVSSTGDRKPAFDELLAREGITRNAAVTVNNFSAVPKLLHSSDLVGVFTERVAGVLVEIFDLKISSLPMQIEPLDHYMVWVNRFETDPKHRWLREQLIKSSC